MPDENEYLMMSFDQYEFTDKDRCINDIALDMLNRLSMMFRYEGEKPDSLDTNYLERYLLYYGKAVIARADDGQLYAFFGNWGGKPGPYYYPTEFIVANPYLNFYKTLKIGVDCVLIKNDSLGLGLKRILEKHATLLTENNLSRVVAEYNSRIQDLLVGEDDKTKASAELFLQRVIEGKLGIISSNAMLDSFNTYRQTSAGGSSIIPLIEHHQYIKSELLQDLGIDSNWNGKREAVNSAETALNKDYLMPLVDDMKRCRIEGMEEASRLFPELNLKPEFDSTWFFNNEETEVELDNLKNESEAPEETKEEEGEKYETETTE